MVPQHRGAIEATLARCRSSMGLLLLMCFFVRALKDMMLTVEAGWAANFIE